MKELSIEEKDLLLRDLCAKLPYNVEVYYSETVPISTLKTINSEKRTCIVYDHSQWYRHNRIHIEEIKPYLRSISSMTEEESREFFELVRESWEFYDYLNAHHFDYRGLIEKGLAIEAPDGMYNLKEK